MMRIDPASSPDANVSVGPVLSAWRLPGGQGAEAHQAEILKFTGLDVDMYQGNDALGLEVGDRWSLDGDVSLYDLKDDLCLREVRLRVPGDDDPNLRKRGVDRYVHVVNRNAEGAMNRVIRSAHGDDAENDDDEAGRRLGEHAALHAGADEADHDGDDPEKERDAAQAAQRVLECDPTAPCVSHVVDQPDPLQSSCRRTSR